LPKLVICSVSGSRHNLWSTPVPCLPKSRVAASCTGSDGENGQQLAAARFRQGGASRPPYSTHWSDAQATPARCADAYYSARSAGGPSFDSAIVIATSAHASAPDSAHGCRSRTGRFRAVGRPSTRGRTCRRMAPWSAAPVVVGRTEHAEQPSQACYVVRPTPSCEDNSVTAHCHAASALLTREYRGDHRRQSQTPTTRSRARVIVAASLRSTRTTEL
jgi:hypothetical protein